MTKDGKYDIGLTVNDGYAWINGQNAFNNFYDQNIEVRSGYFVQDKEVEKIIKNPLTEIK